MQKFITTFKKGLLPFGGIIIVVGALMLAQPDTDTFAVMAMSAIAMFITAGGRWRDMFIVGAIGLVLFAGLVFERPYLMARVKTFIDPSADQLGKSWQVKQSLIAIGSGGFAGRGFGQSIQKFEYLPEPTSDAIFAVFGEEFGFIGTTLLVILYSLFLLRSFRIAAEAADLFGMLLVVGFSMIIVIEAFLNIASMLAIFPLGGIPLPFISHGGTALLASLASVGVMLNVSRYRKRQVVKKV
jgi:cell division protein FtsW